MMREPDGSPCVRAEATRSKSNAKPGLMPEIVNDTAEVTQRQLILIHHLRELLNLCLIFRNPANPV